MPKESKMYSNEPSPMELMKRSLLGALKIICEAIEESKDKDTKLEYRHRAALNELIKFADEFSKLTEDKTLGWRNLRNVSRGSVSSWDYQFALQESPFFARHIDMAVSYLHGSMAIKRTGQRFQGNESEDEEAA
jgi:hypothetical protein